MADGNAARRSTGIGLRHRSHHPYWPSSLTDEQFDDVFDRWYTRRQAAVPGWRMVPREQWPADLLAELEQSWEGLFDPSAWERTEPVQACLGTLYCGDVVDAVRLVNQAALRPGARPAR